MRFSEAFGIRPGRYDWFDPDLTIDTPLFLDPVLLLASRRWRRAHAELIDHFARCYELVAKGGSRHSNSARLAHRLLTFPEPWEFCLGYTSAGTRGAGSGQGYAETLADGIAVSIAVGLGRPEHIEEIGILNGGFGADRISDAVCNALKRHFITYTQSVARRHNVPLGRHRVRNARVDWNSNRWITELVDLPTNPRDESPIILVPHRLLNDLPVVNAEDWFDSNLNADLRTDLNLEIGKRVPKQTIVDLARAHPQRVRRWADEQANRPDLSGYDFEEDRNGVVGFDGAPVTFAATNPLRLEIRPPRDQQELSDLVKDILGQFKTFIEDQRGWDLLWNSDGSEKPEQAAQLVFLGMARHHLELFDVEVDREVELGRGPVDLKIASGSSKKLLIEIKKTHNGKFWNGLEAQLPSYLQSDGSIEGWFVAIRYRDAKSSASRMGELPDRVRRMNTGQQRIEFIGIDGRRKMSASKI